MKMICSKECFGRTRVNLIQTKKYMVDKLCSTIESVPRWCSTYCCVCCYYRRRKSIGVTQENNQKSGQGTPVIPIAITGEYNKNAVQSQSRENSVTPSPVNETPPVTPHSTLRLELSPKPQTKHYTDKHNGNVVEGWSNGDIKQESTPPPQQRQEDHQDRERPYSTPKTTVVATMQSSPNGVDLNSSVELPPKKAVIIEADLPNIEPHEISNGEVVIQSISPEKEVPNEASKPNSALSKAESTNAEVQSTNSEELEITNTADTPDYESQAITLDSRPQSVVSTKSQVIEEELDGEPSVVVEPDRVSEVTQEVLEDLSDIEDTNSVPKTPNESSTPIKELPVDHEPEVYTPNIEDTLPSPPRSPTIDEIKALSRKSSFAKSCESLYDRPQSKQDILDNSTETSSDYQSSQLNNTITDFIPVKPQHIPLQRKSKTSCFMKNHRRVSPVKQSIKMSQAELFPQNMTRFDKPRDALNKTFDQLDSSNWEIIVMGLKSMVRLMRYHPETLDNQMHMTCIQLTKSVRNLRSQVSRAACQASTELFTMNSKFLEQECDDLVCALLHRTADTNRFLRADANRGLESMCDNLTPPKVLNILTSRGAAHQNALVRTTTAKLLNRLADRLGCDKIFTMGRENRDKFILTGANLLLEGSLETRSYAKSLFRMLSNHQNYSRLILEVIPTRTYRNIEKTLKNIH